MSDILNEQGAGDHTVAQLLDYLGVLSTDVLEMATGTSTVTTEECVANGDLIGNLVTERNRFTATEAGRAAVLIDEVRTLCASMDAGKRYDVALNELRQSLAYEQGYYTSYLKYSWSVPY